MERHPLKHSENPSFALHTLPVTLLGMLLALVPAAFGQHLAGGRSGSFRGGHVGGISSGGFHGGFSAPRSFGGFAGPAGRSAPPRMNWTAPHYGSVPGRSAYPGYRSSYRTANRRGGNHREPYRRPYSGNGYDGYPSTYVNSWELLPWDLGYPEFTDSGDENDATQPNNAQIEPSGGEQELPPEEDQGYRPEYVPAPYRPPARVAVTETPPTNEPKLTLIFKDGHTLAIQNYVLTPKEVIVMDDATGGHVPRISLFELNLDATEKAAQQAGLDFSPPAA